MQHNTGKSISGFTLIELMVVVAVVGVLAGIATPNMVQTIRQQRALNSEKRVEDAVRRARNYARVSLCEVSLEVSSIGAVDTLTWQTTESDASLPCGALTDVYSQSFRPEISIAHFREAGVQRSPFLFNDQGGTDYAGEATIAISNSTGSGRVLEVWPMIGSIQVQ